MSKSRIQILNEDERSLIVNALHSAAAKYQECADVYKNGEAGENTRLRNQFLKQVAEAVSWADAIENCDQVTIQA